MKVVNDRDQHNLFYFFFLFSFRLQKPQKSGNNILTIYSVTVLFSHLFSSVYMDKSLKIRDCMFFKHIPNKIDLAPSHVYSYKITFQIHF